MEFNELQWDVAMSEELLYTVQAGPVLHCPDVVPVAVTSNACAFPAWQVPDAIAYMYMIRALHAYTMMRHTYRLRSSTG